MAGDYLQPVSGIMLSLGDGGWSKNSNSLSIRRADDVPSLATFDVNADGQQIFIHYCMDTIDVLLEAMESKSRSSQAKKATCGVFLANSVSITEKFVRESPELSSLLGPKLPTIVDPWKKKATTLYIDPVKDVSMHLVDIVTARANTTKGGDAGDSATIVKSLSSKERENIKGKFTSFNTSFDDFINRHKQFKMERDVRQLLARNVHNMLEPLYNRFYDRYVEIDKGRGKYIKYTKPQLANVFQEMYN